MEAEQTSDPAFVVLAAFRGWSNAAEAATDAVEYLLDVWPIKSTTQIAQDEYYSYTENRPEVFYNEAGIREIDWPSTTIAELDCPNLPNTKVFVITGSEPNLRWQRYCTELLSIINPSAPGLLITLGGIPAEVLHNRPIHVHGHTANPKIQAVTGFEDYGYEGPVNMLMVLQDELEAFGFNSVSLWADVPHYISTNSCPKASLALLQIVEDILDIPIPLDELVDNARAWQDSADAFVESDEDMSDYVRSLEEGSETAELPEASGEAIAREFERYLRRRES